MGTHGAALEARVHREVRWSADESDVIVTSTGGGKAKGKDDDDD